MYRDALASAPDDAEAMHYLGLCLIKSGRSSEGMPLVARSVQLAPRRAMYRQNFGQMFIEAGDPASAERELSEAIALDSSSAVAHNCLAACRT